MTKTRSLLSNPLISVQGHSGWSLSQQIRVQGRTTWTGHPYMAGPLTFTQTGTVSTHQSTSHTQLWDVGGNNGIWRIPHRHGRRCQLHRDSEPSPIDFFLWWLNKTVLLRATVVDIENAYSEMEATWRGTSTRVEGRVTWTLKLALKTECEQMV